MGVPLSFRVEDMTCGHCAGTIKGAVESGIPGATVETDPSRKLVSVTGTADRTRVAALIAGAGYTPETV